MGFKASPIAVPVLWGNDIFINLLFPCLCPNPNLHCISPGLTGSELRGVRLDSDQVRKWLGFHNNKGPLAACTTYQMCCCPGQSRAAELTAALFQSCLPGGDIPPVLGDNSNRSPYLPLTRQFSPQSPLPPARLAKGRCSLRLTDEGVQRRGRWHIAQGRASIESKQSRADDSSPTASSITPTSCPLPSLGPRRGRGCWWLKSDTLFDVFSACCHICCAILTGRGSQSENLGSGRLRLACGPYPQPICHMGKGSLC